MCLSIQLSGFLKQWTLRNYNFPEILFWEKEKTEARGPAWLLEGDSHSDFSNYFAGEMGDWAHTQTGIAEYAYLLLST